MTWFKVDDAFWAHPKTLALSDAAVALWVRAGSYCAQHLTDGAVPASALWMMRSDEFVAHDLVAAGLWKQTPTGYLFHDWAKYQPTRESIEAEREAGRERQRASREKRLRVTPSVTRDNHRESQRPDPARPDPSESSKELSPTTEAWEQFDDIWAHWPKKASKQPALSKWERLSAKQRREIMPLLIEHGDAFRIHTPVEFVPMLSTFINQQRWSDPLATARTGSSSQRDANATVLARYAQGDQA